MNKLDKMCFFVKHSPIEWGFYIQEGKECRIKGIEVFDVENGYISETILDVIERYMLLGYVYVGIIDPTKENK